MQRLALRVDGDCRDEISVSAVGRKGSQGQGLGYPRAWSRETGAWILPPAPWLAGNPSSGLIYLPEPVCFRVRVQIRRS